MPIRKFRAKQRDEKLLFACMLQANARGEYMSDELRELMHKCSAMLVAEAMETPSRPSKKDLHKDPPRCIDDPEAYLSALDDRT